MRRSDAQSMHPSVRPCMHACNDQCTVSYHPIDRSSPGMADTEHASCVSVCGYEGMLLRCLRACDWEEGVMATREIRHDACIDDEMGRHVDIFAV
jgi:hypothetical protein